MSKKTLRRVLALVWMVGCAACNVTPQAQSRPPSTRGLVPAATSSSATEAASASTAAAAEVVTPPVELHAWSQEEAAAAFELAAKTHGADLIDLYSVKGVLRPSGEPEMTLKQAANILGEVAKPAYAAGTAVLFYALTEEGLGMWLVDAGGLRAFADVKASESMMDVRVGALRRALGVDASAVARGLFFVAGSQDVAEPPATVPTDGAMVARPANSVAIAAEALREVVLPPPILAVLAEVKHLIVVPTLGIGTIPFALLPTADGRMVIDDRTVTVAVSLFEVGESIAAWRPPRPGTALVIGDPTMPTLKKGALPPLPGAAREAVAVAKMWRSKALLGGAATESAVVQAAAGAELIHFATHAISGSARALDTSFLALAPTPQDDGFFSGREIVGLRLQAKLVVLSACQTGLGQLHRAGVIGLARAFQKARVPRVVMSLWNVDDDATAMLMTTFTQQLQSDVPAVALRKATLATRRRHPDPRAWAAFVLLGTPR